MQAITPAQAAALIPDGATVATAGFVGVGHAEAISRAIEPRVQRVVFMGTLTNDGLRIETGDGRLRIVQESRVKKLAPAGRGAPELQRA